MGRVGLRQTPGPGDQPLPGGTCFLSCSKTAQATQKPLSILQAKEASEALAAK